MKNTLMISLSTVAIAALLSACGGNDKKGNNREGNDENLILANATNPSSPAKVNLATNKTVTDNSWHFAYQKYVGFKSNGGTSGTGEVKVCLAKTYPTLYDSQKNPVEAEFRKLTIENTKADFDAVNKSNCKDSDYMEDSIKTQIKTSDWRAYDMSTHIVSAKTDVSNGWLLRSASKTNDKFTYARIKVKEVNATRTSTKLKFEFEKYDGTKFLAKQESPELDFSKEKIYWDLETNSVVGANDNWELAISVRGRDYPIQVNGGASGKGNAGIGIIMKDYTVDTVTNPENTKQVYKYFKDTATGNLSKPGSYGAFQYGVAGRHKMWPTFAVYIFKQGSDYYKAQIVSNYGEDGTLKSGNLVIRTKKID